MSDLLRALAVLKSHAVVHGNVNEVARDLRRVDVLESATNTLNAVGIVDDGDMLTHIAAVAGARDALFERRQQLMAEAEALSATMVEGGLEPVEGLDQAMERMRLGIDNIDPDSDLVVMFDGERTQCSLDALDVFQTDIVLDDTGTTTVPVRDIVAVTVCDNGFIAMTSKGTLIEAHDA